MASARNDAFGVAFDWLRADRHSNRLGWRDLRAQRCITTEPLQLR